MRFKYIYIYINLQCMCHFKLVNLVNCVDNWPVTCKEKVELAPHLLYLIPK